MKLVVWLVLLFVVAVVAAITLGANDGLASFYWRGWRLRGPARRARCERGRWLCKRTRRSKGEPVTGHVLRGRRLAA